jgi:hypothetical protein
MRKSLALWALLLALYPALARPTAASPVHPGIVQAPVTLSPPAVLESSVTLQNPNMECANGGFVPQSGIPGLVPRGWTALVLNGRPDINSARTYFLGSYCAGGWVEHLEGDDALVMASQDLETPPVPGKPFDALVYQRVAVTPGTSYNLSAWMLSFCGGSFDNPNDCPSGYYIAKMLGVDPAGGTDPNAPTVVWTEDRQNFNQARWGNLDLGVTAQGSTLTIFARVRSPFQHHGNYALLDAVSVEEAPSAQFGSLPAQATGTSATIAWHGTLSKDILAIPSGTYQLRYEVQSRLGLSGDWQGWIAGAMTASAQFTSTVPASTYYFRLRGLAEQQQGVPGAWPNHRYIGDWQPSTPVSFGNHPPVAVADTLSTPENTLLQISALDNDNDPDPSQTLSISSAGPAKHGRVTYDAHLIHYSPDPDFNGTDVLTYTINDGGLLSAPGTVTVTVIPVDDPPRIRNIGTRLNAAGESVWLPLGIYDPESEPITVTVLGLPPGLALAAESHAISGTLSEKVLGPYPITVTAADPEESTEVSFDWRILDQVWRSRLPLISR